MTFQIIWAALLAACIFIAIIGAYQQGVGDTLRAESKRLEQLKQELTKGRSE